MFDVIKRILFIVVLFGPEIEGAPNLCDVVSSKTYNECYNYKTSGCTCPGYPPRPCTFHKYRIPNYFIEVVTSPAKSFFKDLPIKSYEIDSKKLIGYVSEDNSLFFHVRIAPVTYSFPFMNFLTCGGADPALPCVIASSTEMKKEWHMSKKDWNQPAYKLWKNNPGLCKTVGALNQTGESLQVTYPSMPFVCGLKPILKINYPPSLRNQCTAWGNRYPRVGVVNSGVPLFGALLAGMRFNSIGNEVFLTVPNHQNSRWQMLYPSQSSCFKEGEGLISTRVKGVKEGQERLKDLSLNMGKRHGMYLFAVWKEVMCCKDLSSSMSHKIAEEALKVACQGLKGGTQ